MRKNLIKVGSIVFLLLGLANLLMLYNNASLLTQKSYFIGDHISITIISDPKMNTNHATLLIHGFSGSKENMKILAYSLAHAGFFSILVDLPGHGSSGGVMNASIDSVRVSQFEHSIFAVLRFLGSLNHKFSTISLIGHSMGGALACYLGIKFRNISAVVGIAPAIGLFADIQPENFSVYTPNNLLFIIGGLDVIIRNDIVENAFSRSVGGNFKYDEHYSIDGHHRTIHKVALADHVSIIFNDETIDWVTSWLCLTILGKNPKFYRTPNLLLGLTSLLSLLLGFIMIMHLYFFKPKIIQHKEKVSFPYSPRILAMIIALGTPLAVLSIIILFLITRLIVSALALGVLIGSIIAILTINKNTEKPSITISKKNIRNFILGLLFGITIIFIIELSIGWLVASIINPIQHRTFSLMVFWISSAYLIYILTKTHERFIDTDILSIIKASTNNFLLFVPYLIITAIIGLLAFPTLLPFLLTIALIYSLLLSILLLSNQIFALPIETKVSAGALILGIIATVFSPALNLLL